MRAQQDTIRRLLRRTLIAVFLVLLTGVLLSHRAKAGGCRASGPATIDDFDAPGMRAIGTRTITFIDASRPTPPAGSFPGAPARSLVTEVWYPALEAGRDAAVDVAGGPYPVVIFSHGGNSTRFDGLLVGQHLASRGMIVAAPDYPLTSAVSPAGLVLEDYVNQPADWSFVLDGVLGVFGAAADATRVGATGHSLGGLTTLLVTYHRDLRDPRIQAALPMAPLACFLTRRFYRTTKTPLLVMHGDSDQITHFPTEGRAAYRRARGARFLVRLKNGSHSGYGPFATIFDPTEHLDRFLCTLAIFETAPEDFYAALTTPLGDREAGIRVKLQRCSRPCLAVPDQPAMAALRHQQLTRVTQAAFFEAYLLGNDAARCFLRRTLGREADVRTRREPGG